MATPSFGFMKHALITVYMLLSFVLGYGKQIDSTTAKTIAQNLIFSNASFQARPANISLNLYYKSISSGNSTVYYYVFNISPMKGFVIVAGDDNVTPILGYSTESYFDTTKMSDNTAKWLERYKNQIRRIIVNKIHATNIIQSKWAALLSPSKVLQQTLGLTISPLIQTTWDQAASPRAGSVIAGDYNALCPYDSTSGETTYTGCVATAMAQIMKYWNYPVQGQGIHYYNDPPYGKQSANFGSTTYQWGSMPNSLTLFSSSAQINAVSLLMYEVGVSVNMQYGISGSSAYSAQTVYALKHYFSYSNAIRLISLDSMPVADWIDSLETELNGGRPVLYSGADATDGHCFILDGYDDNNNFHINWGWSGQDNGYFQIGFLNPSDPGDGGGSGNYDNDNVAIIGIQPPTNQQTYNVALYNTVSPVDSTIGYGQPFNIRANFINDGTNTFSGDIGALIFDASFNFVDSLQIHYGESLQSNFIFTNGLSFSTTGKLSMLPGKYYVATYYRPTGGDWIIVNNGNYNNLSEIDIVNNNSIALNSVINVTPANLIQGQSLSANLNIVNNGTSTFVGKYEVALYNLDGTFAQAIGTVTESNGLPSTYTYLSPYLTFTNSVISVTPGSYYLALEYMATNGTWQLGGTGNYENPIKVNIQPTPLLPDKYEPNDTITKAYNLPIVFTSDSANVNTVGSNFHTGTDNDYYKVVLPIGSDYIINARLDDSYSSNNGNTYTVDATFAYSINDTSWSDYFDDVMPNNITAHGGDTVYFYVTHYFIGSVGTYLLNMNIMQVPTAISWTGITSTDWNTPSNWSTSVVPSSDDDVIINSGTPFNPIINNGVVGSCKSIHANNSSILTVGTGGNLIIAGH